MQNLPYHLTVLLNKSHFMRGYDDFTNINMMMNVHANTILKHDKHKHDHEYEHLQALLHMSEISHDAALLRKPVCDLLVATQRLQVQVCVCVRERERGRGCVCVCERERGRGCVCVCV